MGAGGAWVRHCAWECEMKCVAVFICFVGLRAWCLDTVCVWGGGAGVERGRLGGIPKGGKDIMIL